MTGRARWAIRAGAICWFVGALGFLLALPILLQAWIWALPILVLIAIVLALPVAWGWHRFVARTTLRHAWLKAALAVLFLLAIIIAAPVYGLVAVTQLRPALVPQVVLTNDRKVVVFQGMQHVAAERFFKMVVFDLEDALSRGYVLFYEGVRPSTPEADRWFAATMSHGRDLTDTYRDFGQLCGLTFQNDYLAIVGRDAKTHPQSHVVADVSTADMMRVYDTLLARDPAFGTAMADSSSGDDADTLQSILQFLKTGTNGQRELAGMICRGMMTVAMTKANDTEAREPMDRVVLDYRNDVLAKRLLDEPRNHIFVTYGAKHLPGVLARLRQGDPHWRVASVKWLRTIDAPERYTASLRGIV